MTQIKKHGQCSEALSWIRPSVCLFVLFCFLFLFLFFFSPQWYYTDCEGREAEVAKEPTSIYSVTSATLLFNKQRSNEWIDSQKNHRRTNIIQCMQCMQQYCCVKHHVPKRDTVHDKTHWTQQTGIKSLHGLQNREWNKSLEFNSVVKENWKGVQQEKRTPALNTCVITAPLLRMQVQTYLRKRFVIHFFIFFSHLSTSC